MLCIDKWLVRTQNNNTAEKQHSDGGISAHRQDDEKEASHCAYWNASQSFDMQEISRRIFWLGF